VEGDIVNIYLISFVASFIENTKYLKKNTATLELVTCALVEGEKHHSTARLQGRAARAETALPAMFR